MDLVVSSISYQLREN